MRHAGQLVRIAHDEHGDDLAGVDDDREYGQHVLCRWLAELGYVISAIKGWNLLNISLRCQIPEVPAPGF